MIKRQSINSVQITMSPPVTLSLSKSGKREGNDTKIQPLPAAFRQAQYDRKGNDLYIPSFPVTLSLSKSGRCPGEPIQFRPLSAALRQAQYDGKRNMTYHQSSPVTPREGLLQELSPSLRKVSLVRLVRKGGKHQSLTHFLDY